MTVKEFIISRIQLFFFFLTLILAASAVIGLVISPETELHYYQLFGPMIIAALCVLPTCVTYFRKEPTIAQFILRRAIELVLIECVVLFMISPENSSIPAPLFYIMLAAVVLIIYVIALLLMWLQKYQQSKKLTAQLKKFQAEN